MSDDRTKEGLFFIVKNGKGFLGAIGTEQRERFGEDDEVPYVEVGPIRTIAFQLLPGELVDVVCGMLKDAATHIRLCDGCKEELLNTIDEIGLFENENAVRQGEKNNGHDPR